jgi:hypothetical protein
MCRGRYETAPEDEEFELVNARQADSCPLVTGGYSSEHGWQIRQRLGIDSAKGYGRGTGDDSGYGSWDNEYEMMNESLRDARVLS